MTLFRSLSSVWQCLVQRKRQLIIFFLQLLRALSFLKLDRLLYVFFTYFKSFFSVYGSFTLLMIKGAWVMLNPLSTVLTSLLKAFKTWNLGGESKSLM